jgi:hypothetical protein
MPRRLVSKKQLSEILTSELHKIEDAEGSRITVQYSLREPDPDGCNWSDSVIVGVGPKASSEYLTPHVQRIVAAARREYNVTD